MAWLPPDSLYQTFSWMFLAWPLSGFSHPKTGSMWSLLYRKLAVKGDGAAFIWEFIILISFIARTKPTKKVSKSSKGGNKSGKSKAIKKRAPKRAHKAADAGHADVAHNDAGSAPKASVQKRAKKSTKSGGKKKASGSKGKKTGSKRAAKKWSPLGWSFMITLLYMHIFVKRLHFKHFFFLLRNSYSNAAQKYSYCTLSHPCSFKW